MRRVWEDNELRASTYRLWQVIQNLRYKLIDVGMTDVFFVRARRNGFIVNLSEVTKLYHEKKHRVKNTQFLNRLGLYGV